MNRVTSKVPDQVPSQIVAGEWVAFPGGELEGKRPKVLCSACREALGRAFDLRAKVGRVLLTRRGLGGGGWTRRHGPQTRRDGIAGRALCFQCYRAEIDRHRALKAAGELDTASAERFQTALPFEPVNRPRLEMLKVERSTARGATLATTSGKFADRRRQAQVAARHALQRIAARLSGNDVCSATRADHAREMASAIHAAELQLPESWLPFVVSR